MIGIGDRVYLKGCPFGEPGQVLRFERKRAIVLWPDSETTTRHRPETLRVTHLGSMRNDSGAVKGRTA